MQIRRHRHLILAAFAAALAVPASAAALPDPPDNPVERVTGGSQAPQSGDQGGSAQPAQQDSGSHGGTQAQDPSFVAEDMTLDSRRRALLKRTLRFRGSVAARDAGATVAIQRLSPSRGWLTVATARSHRDGSFTAYWRTDHIGRFAMRATIVAARDASAGGADSASKVVRVTVYLPTRATIYGPGFYGRKTGCGSRLRESTLGVAHRSLPCGTRVAFFFHGRAHVLRVVDRGPYANGADWDLTMAAARKLGLRTSGRVGAVALRR